MAVKVISISIAAFVNGGIYFENEPDFLVLL